MNIHRISALRLAVAASSLVLTGAFAACGDDSGAGNAAASTKQANPEWANLTFTVGEQSDGIVALAEKSGAFDDVPYKVKWAKFEYGPPLVQAASSGDIDLGNVGAVPPITGAADELGFKIIATSGTQKALAAKGIAVSPRTLRRRLHEAGYRWKRPRYVYVQRAAHLSQKKGGSPDG